MARAHVRDRDRGICAECGLDTERIQEQLRTEIIQPEASTPALRILAYHSAKSARAFVAGLFGARASDWYQSGAWWQADHRVPVSEGGGALGLANLRTLCTECHRQATAALRSRLRKRTAPAPPRREPS